VDPKLKQAIMALLKIFNGNRSKVARILSISRNTVAAVCKEMDEENKGKPYGREGEEKIKRISNEEYKSLLKMVRGLVNRVKNLEEKCDEQNRVHNVLAKFIDNSVTPRLNIVGNEFKNIAKNITKNARDIKDLQREVDIFKEIWHDKFIEIKKRSEAHQTERDRVDAEVNKRAAEIFRETERKREQGPTDVFQQKLKEIKNMDKKRKSLI